MAGLVTNDGVTLVSPNGLVSKTISMDNNGVMTIPQKSLSAGTPVDYIWSGTQAQYDAIGSKDANTIYLIV